MYSVSDTQPFEIIGLSSVSVQLSSQLLTNPLNESETNFKLFLNLNNFKYESLDCMKRRIGKNNHVPFLSLKHFFLVGLEIEQQTHLCAWGIRTILKFNKLPFEGTAAFETHAYKLVSATEPEKCYGFRKFRGQILL